MKKMSKYAVFKELNSPWQFIEAVSEKQAIYFAIGKMLFLL
jgi:ribosome-associated toxin RatA of RatAB toxin-antitoxin module